ncbi:hypothetical protein PSYCG_03865 [Psychrobacter sp. G]|nr:hypothetical protein PSYCG_03865 [Psychrobacter sp. G]
MRAVLEWENKWAQTKFLRQGWRIIYLDCSMIWAVPVLLWIDYI